MEIVIAVLQTGLYQNIYGILFKGLINFTHNSHLIFVWHHAGVQNVFFPAMLAPVYHTASSFFLSLFRQPKPSNVYESLTRQYSAVPSLKLT